MAGAVVSHYLFHMVVKRLSVFGFIHVDKVDHDYSSHVSKPELTSYLIGCFQVDIQSICLLVVRGLAAVSGIDIDHMQRLCVFDDHVCSALKGDCLAKTALNLAGDVEMVKYGYVLRIDLHDLLIFRSDKSHIILNLSESLSLIDIDIFKCRAEDIPYHAYHSRFLFENERRALAPLHLCYGFFPIFHQGAHLIIELRHPFVFSRSAHNHAETLRLDTAHQLTQPDLLLCGFYFLRDGNLIAERHKHHISPGERDLGGETRAFGRDGLFCYLHQQLLTRLHHICDAPLLGDIGFELEFGYVRNLLLISHSLRNEIAIAAELGT